MEITKRKMILKGVYDTIVKRPDKRFITSINKICCFYKEIKIGEYIYWQYEDGRLYSNPNKIIDFYEDDFRTYININNKIYEFAYCDK